MFFLGLVFLLMIMIKLDMEFASKVTETSVEFSKPLFVNDESRNVHYIAKRTGYFSVIQLPLVP